MPDINENGNHVAHADGGKEAKVYTERLKKRIQRHYDVSADQFFKVWGKHIHHSYFKSPTDTNEQAQLNQVIRLAESSGVSVGFRVLDVGCGIGGTARYIARERDCKVTAITNNRRQVEIARELMAAYPPPLPLGAGAGTVRVLNLDVEQMREHLESALGETFNCIWISEVVFHLHARRLFFDSAFALLGPRGFAR